MKLTPAPVRPGSTPRGVALVIVLSMLVLLSALLVAFMTTASTERTASFANAGVTNARQLADSTVSLVIGQIRDATTVDNDDTTWSSQPGAIRTFAGTLNGVRKPLRDKAYYDGYAPSARDSVYKLYSADRLMLPASDYTNSDLGGETSLIEKWDPLKPAANDKDYVDLNQPVLIPRRDLDPNGGTVEPHYPIVDPRAKLDLGGADVAGADPGIVDGFDGKIARDTALKMPKPVGTGTVSVPYLAMPVKWLYVLRDGTIGPASLASTDNPIVGRTAFWTDDETCKLNINTAMEGTYWDTPVASSTQESGNIPGNSGALLGTNFGLQLAASQPARGEIYRYPGHPATTCLSPVFGQLLNASPNLQVLPINATSNKGTWTYPWLANGAVNTVYRDFKDQLYRMLPFGPNYDPGFKGTSYAATRNTDIDVDPFGNLKSYTKHLYTSVDEMIFKSNKTGGATANDLNLPLTAEALEKTRFFLTASSRAPELNIFSRPRITLWPVSSAYKYRTPADDLFLFTSTIRKDPDISKNGKDDKKFCFMRWDARSMTHDYEGDWASPATQDTQNKKMIDYLQNLTGRPVPGFGGNFLSKWPSKAGGGPTDRDEILTMIFDYVRAINIVDTGTASRAANVFVPYTPQFYGTKKDVTYDPRNTRSYDWSGQVTPTVIPTLGTQGMGRFVTPIEVAIIFYGTTPPPGSPAGAKYMKAALAIEMGTTMPGFPGIRETYYTVVRPMQGAKRRVTKVKTSTDTDPVDINLCSNDVGLVNICNIPSHEVGYGRAFMPTLGFRSQMHWFKEPPQPSLLQSPPEAADPNHIADFTVSSKIFKNDSPDSLVGKYRRGSTVTIYPYVSNAIKIAAGTTFTLEAGNFDIEIHAAECPVSGTAGPFDPRDIGPGAAPGAVQIVHVDFPHNDQTNAVTPVSLKVPVSTVDFPARFEQVLDGNGWNVIQAGDRVRSMELTCGFDPAASPDKCGDVRLAAGLHDVPASYFSPRDGTTVYTNTNADLVHGLVIGHGDVYTGHTGGGHIGANAPGTRKPPILPKNTNGVKRADGGPGDWDKGLSKHMDGAFGNKVDEGNLRFAYGNGSPQSIPYYLGRSIEETGQSFFTPNRQISSSIMLGSLPTGVIAGKPWETLLFHPNRETGTVHPGADTAKGPPDHLIADLFTIPVIEPYAISEPFSTAGKVNLNYVIAPFGYAKNIGGSNTDTNNPRSYLRRDTALRGVLKSEFIMAVPKNQPECGHAENPLTDAGGTVNFRFPIFLNRTLEALETRLQAKDGQYPLFRSASEICTVDLYPHLSTSTMKTTVTDWETFWNTDMTLTGDNARERPYAHIYPRLTTRSNVYTVHMRTQAIKKSPKSDPNIFDPTKDSVVGEYRGSATIERFIDPNDEKLKNYDPKADKVDGYYRYRIVNTKVFSPK